MEAAAFELQAKDRSDTESGDDYSGERSDHSKQQSQRQSWAVLAANCCLLLAGGGGGALLAWWALSFHNSNEQLWMVPVGLVLLGTPVFAWLSIFGGSAAGMCRGLKPLCSPPRPPDLESTCHATI